MNPATRQHSAADEAALLAALRSGDEGAFLALVDRHHPCLLRVARALHPEGAEALAMEAWRDLFEAARRGEAMPPVRTLAVRLLVACARRAGRAVRFEARPAVAPSRFQAPGSRYPSNWTEPPQPWDEGRLPARSAAAALERHLRHLPPGEAAVFTLRDVEGWDPADVCAALGVGEREARAALNRARSWARAALEAAGGEKAR